MTFAQPHRAVSAVLSVFMLLATAPVGAQQPSPAETPAATPSSAASYEPAIGQPGKDVVWVPTPQALVDKMLDMARVTPKDYLVDLGSGDGRLVITAAKRGVRALGIEYNPEMVELSKRAAEAEGEAVTKKVEFIKADIFETDFSDATVVTMFLLPELNLKLRPTLLRMKPGTRIVSNSFDMGDWKPDRTERVGPGTDCVSWCVAHLWIIPARVEGTHRLKQGELTLAQQYQMVTGTLRKGDRMIDVTGKVIGDRVVLRAGSETLRGRVGRSNTLALR